MQTVYEVRQDGVPLDILYADKDRALLAAYETALEELEAIAQAGYDVAIHSDGETHTLVNSACESLTSFEIVTRYVNEAVLGS